jgi:DNA-binding NtrC family response regulator
MNVPEILTLAEAERAHIIQVLIFCGGNRTHAAHRLQISIRTLRNKLDIYRSQGHRILESYYRPEVGRPKKVKL